MSAADATFNLVPLPRGTCNHSACDQFCRCAACWEFQHIQGFKQRGGAPLVLGSACHKAWQMADQSQLEGKPRTDWVRLQDYFREVLPLEIQKTQERTGMEIEWGDDTLATLTDDGVKMVKVYEERVGINIRPMFAEESFRVQFDNTDWVFTGRIDLAVADPNDKVWPRRVKVIDRKTKDKKAGAMEVLVTPQLRRYQLGVKYGLDEQVWRAKANGTWPCFVIGGVGLHVIVRPHQKTPEGDVQVFEIPAATPEELMEELANVGKIVHAMQSGFYPQVQNWMLCSWCPFLDTCQPKWHERKMELEVEAKLAAAQKEADKASPKKGKGRKPVAVSTGGK